MAVGARCANGIGCVEHVILIFRLRGLESGQSRLPESLNELHPIRIPQGNAPAVRTPASGNRKEVCGFGQSQRAILDRHPSSIGIGQGICRQRRISRRLHIGRIVALSEKDDIRIGKQDAPHHLGKVPMDLRGRRRGAVLGSCPRNTLRRRLRLGDSKEGRGHCRTDKQQENYAAESHILHLNQEPSIMLQLEQPIGIFKSTLRT
jgi:hypothetical protein